MKIDQLRAYGVAGGCERKGEITLHIRASECDTIEQARVLFDAAPDMIDMLYRLLPVIEDAKADPCYIPGYIARLERDLLALLDRVEVTSC
jgi:hypothetical protein